jgi:predicted flap endonuclease-1-like 5' DNA nuclease
MKTFLGYNSLRKENIMSIEEIEGIGPGYAAKLAETGVTSIESLLTKGGDGKGRAALSKATDISEKLLLKWVNHADMCRLTGVGPQTAELLEAAGVDSVPELAQRNAANLAAKLDEVNALKNLVNRVPNEGTIAGWIEEAKTLPKKVTN